MLASDRQVNYLECLQDKVEVLYKKGYVKRFTRMDWRKERGLGMTIDDASIRIRAYKEIIFWSNVTMDLLG